MMNEVDGKITRDDHLHLQLPYGAVAMGMASSAATQIAHPLAQNANH
jgi:hypothetical protein